MYLLAKHMGRPLPRFSDDDFIDYVVAEAVMLRGINHEKQQVKQKEISDWKRRPLGSGTPARSM